MASTPSFNRPCTAETSPRPAESCKAATSGTDMGISGHEVHTTTSRVALASFGEMPSSSVEGKPLTVLDHNGESERCLKGESAEATHGGWMLKPCGVTRPIIKACFLARLFRSMRSWWWWEIPVFYAQSHICRRDPSRR